MRIVLLRHGRPEINGVMKLRANEIHEWIKAYNMSGLSQDDHPPREVVEIAGECNTIVCSDLPRSIDSAHALGLHKISCMEKKYREVGLPYADIKMPKLDPKIWAAIFRMLWFLGYSANGESLKEAKSRARRAALTLEGMAKDTGSVLLVGHGFMNKFIASVLLSNGWDGPSVPGRNYWEYGVYQYAT